MSKKITIKFKAEGIDLDLKNVSLEDVGMAVNVLNAEYRRKEDEIVKKMQPMFDKLMEKED